MDWQDVRVEYEATSKSLATIAAERGINLNTLKARARRENWVKVTRRPEVLARTIERERDNPGPPARPVRILPSSGGNGSDPQAGTWAELELEYITAHFASYRTLAKKYRISETAVKKRMKKGRWAEKRRRYWEDVKAAALDLLKERQAAANAQHFEVANRLLEKVEAAIEQLNKHLAKRTVSRRRKRVEVETIKDGEKEKRVPVGERIEEHTREEPVIVEGLIDRQGLRDLARAVKDLTTVQRLAMGMSTTNASLDLTSDGKPGVVILPALAPLPPEEGQECDSS